MRHRKQSPILILPLLLVFWFFPARADVIEDITNTTRKFVQAVIESDVESVKEVTTPGFYADLQSAKGATLAEKISPYVDIVDLGGITRNSVRARVVYSEFVLYEILVLHTNGTSSWKFRFDESGKIANAVFVRPAPGGGSATYRAPPARRRPAGPEDCFNGSGVCPKSAVPVAPKREVEFFFATDRKPKAGSSPIEFIGDRQDTLSFGAVSVRVPEDHNFGKIELPDTWKVFGYEIYREKDDDEKHFSIKRESVLSYADWVALLKEQMRAPRPVNDTDGWDSGGALVFVHGFDNSFEDAVYRYAQVVWDLRYKGLAILYSWSSKGEGFTDYGYDRESANSGREGFIQLLSKLQNELGIKKINVIAHSMGNFIVVDSLNNNSASSKPLHLEQVIMAAPDVDRIVFTHAIPNLHKIVKGMTLYASAADKALRASASLAKFPRAGDVPDPDGPVVVSNLDTIDVTAVGDEFLGLNHSEFATNRLVMDDMKQLFQGKPPPRSEKIHPVPAAPASPKYWRYE
jgi:esterase/lipase superfamily enzyme